MGNNKRKRSFTHTNLQAGKDGFCVIDQADLLYPQGDVGSLDCKDGSIVPTRRQAVELWAGVPACCRATRQDDVLASSPCGRYREVSLLGKGRSNARTTLGPRVRHANGLLPVSLTRTSLTV
ncbi:hypothetical protein RUM44_011554 [Polyplax serrata]|uniref:Uncharacterized protein n=1 Tax=Polyplax serrata TaxID=468196 RepID=A0ABR1AQF6_POLSC